MLDLGEELLGDVLIAVPGCPDMTAEKAIARAARQFCNDSHAWRVTTESQPVIKGLRDVELGIPSGTTILRPYWVTLKYRQLLGVSASKITTEEGTPTGYVISPSGTLMLDCLPDETVVQEALVAHLALVPKRGELVLADELEPFLDMIQSLATAYLLSTPSVEWGNRHAASDMFSLYQSGVPEARRFGQQRNQSIHRTVKYGGI
ncbi:hypothetical protein [Vreelandella massiliensis]|uniref:hypothetical protein n=1 Tax=Vreelandella massiliensis TaxID=1816686 RepID=UPI00096A72AA|nr:hypothetical protein [Halomonas massiliensis]